MKKYILLLIITITLITISLNANRMEEDTSHNVKLRDEDYHFIFVPKEKNEYWEEIEKGILEEAEKRNVSISILSDKYYDKKNHISKIDRAIESGCDGIIAFTLNDSEYSRIIDRSTSMDIPFIAVENDVLNSTRNSYVGINNYYAGVKMADKLFNTIDKSGEVGVIMNNEENNLRLIGIYDEKKKFPLINITKVAYMDAKKINTYKIIEEMVLENKHIKGIICNDEYSTYIAGQVLVRLNKVGKIKIIGMGDLTGIQRFVKKGVIEGVYIKNPENIGMETLDILMKVKTGEFVENAIFSDLIYFDKDDVYEE
ncbi:sugar ABC transporter substrate-binding protein [Anaeromicrobium sediminis]|uniref:Periplasmic binding protein domain-containing protein n=1 Tax=Anaeromicrobium sediminis TaxID=1478221 RepID=A0A267MJ92_9FIRM|nr:substrate-binding domain-containing protein [Anaeromicrobium sediminis]PAB59517.1 hypothetical protein CCE28_09895 [Anaeromicrobium sediminis]